MANALILNRHQAKLLSDMFDEPAVRFYWKHGNYPERFEILTEIARIEGRPAWDRGTKAR